MSFRPELIWVIQPENKIRFRYESEGGSHGALAGKTGKKTYPTLQLKNYTGRKKILVRVSLYTEDEKEHVFEFKGKKDEGKRRYIDEELQSDNKVVFKNLHILCKKKYEIEQILMDRKIKNLKDGMPPAVRQTLEKSYSKDVKDRARSILNSLRLRFDAFEADKPGVLLCTLFSDVISNLKAAGKGDLRICRLSQIAGTWKGGDEIILLCEKVQKDNIRVRFYETNEQNGVIWQEYGDFSPVDVHYQVAIPFKTPPYRRNEEKKVFICLERDGELSEPREFTYKPDEPSTKKRKLDIPVSDMPGIWSQESTGSVSSLSVSSPESSSNAASNEMPSALLWNGLDQVDIKDEIMPFDMNCDFDLSEFINKNAEDFDLSFVNLLGGNLDDIDNGCDGPCFSKIKNQIFDHNYERVYIPVDVIDAPKNEDVIKNQNLDLIDIDVGVGNLKIKNEDELASRSVNKFVRKENESSRNSFHDLQHLLKMDSYGNTLLHMGVILNKNIVPILRISNAVKVDLINVQNHKNQTALHIASEKNRIEAVKILLRCGSNPNLKDSNGNTCYHIAARNDYHHILQEINRFSHFRHEVCVFNDDGLTPMHQAILQRNPHLFDLLKIHMTNSNVVEKKAGKSLLHYAVDFLPILLPTFLEMVDLNVNIQDFEGNTPLHIACANENIAAVRKLLRAGADPSIKNFKQNSNTLDIDNSEDDASDGQLPADLTVNFEIIKLLNAASETPVEDSLSLQNSFSFQEPYKKPCQTTERLCKYLDEDMKWKQLAPFFLDYDIMDSLNLSPSPAHTLLDYVKKQEQDNYIEELKNALEFADLKDGLNIMNEINVVN